MKHVELIRGRIVRGLLGELGRLRIFLSTTDGNQAAIDALSGDQGNKLLGELTDHLMRRLGHEIETPLEDAASRVRRAVSRVRGA